MFRVKVRVRPSVSVGIWFAIRAIGREESKKRTENSLLSCFLFSVFFFPLSLFLPLHLPLSLSCLTLPCLLLTFRTLYFCTDHVLEFSLDFILDFEKQRRQRKRNTKTRQSETKTRQRQDRDNKIETRQRQDKDKTKTKTKTRQRQDKDKTKTRQRQDRDNKTETRQRQDKGKTKARQRQRKLLF